MSIECGRAGLRGRVAETCAVRAGVALVVVGIAACAPSLSSFQPAHVARKGHFQASGGMEFSVSTASVSNLIDSAKVLTEAAQTRVLTDDEKLSLFGAALNLAVSPPLSAGPHVSVAYTVVDRLELSLRRAGGATRAGTRYQLLSRDRHPLDLTAGVGVSRFTYKFPLVDAIPGGILEVTDFTRWQIDVPIVAGTSHDWFRVWGGPRFIYTSIGTEVVLNLIVEEHELAALKGGGFFVGGQGGFALGYKKCFLAFELTFAKLFGDATVSVVGKSAQEVDLDSFVFQPSIGLVVEL